MGWKKKLRNWTGSVVDAGISVSGFGAGYFLNKGWFSDHAKDFVGLGAATIGFGAGYLMKDQFNELLGLNQKVNVTDIDSIRAQLQQQESDAATEAAYLRRQALLNNLL